MALKNSELPKLLCSVIIDKSGSMEGLAIDQVNNSICELINILQLDECAKLNTELCIIEFSDTVSICQPFSLITKIKPPHFEASGMSSFNQAILEGIIQLKNRKKHYLELGFDVYRPWLFAITDGYPTDVEYEKQVREVLEHEINNHKLMAALLGITGADMRHLESYPCNLCVEADRSEFFDSFKWLGNSLCVCSKGIEYSDHDAINDISSFHSMRPTKR